VTPGARIQAAIDVLERWRSGGDGLDRVLAAWGRANRYAGSGDRRAVADLVYDTTRRLRSAAWVAGVGDDGSSRDRLLGNLILDGAGAADLAALFSGTGHAPAPLTAAELARVGRPLETAPRAVRLDVPDWLAPQLAAVADPVLDALRRRAPLFLRVNLLRAEPGEAIAALAAEQIEAAPGPLAPTCLRVHAGAHLVHRSAAYRDGLVEVQDAASQAAGAGGKTLALAAAMGGQGSSGRNAPGSRLSCTRPVPPRRWPDAAIWSSSMHRAPDRVPGRAIRMPSGASRLSASPLCGRLRMPSSPRPPPRCARAGD